MSKRTSSRRFPRCCPGGLIAFLLGEEIQQWSPKSRADGVIKAVAQADSVIQRRFAAFSYGPAWVGPNHGDFRSTPVNGRSQDGQACLKGANSSRGTHPELDAAVAEVSATDFA
jgi:hypothetical protein